MGRSKYEVNMAKFLKLEALKKANSKYELILIKAVDVNNVSQADLASLSLMVYGEMDHEVEADLVNTEAKKYNEERFEQMIEEKIQRYGMF